MIFYFVSQGWNCLKISSFILNFCYCCQVIYFFKFRYFFLILILNLKHHKKNCGVKYDPLGMLSSGCITHWRGHRKCWKLNTLINTFSHSFAAQYEQYWSLEYLANNSFCLSIEPIEDPVTAYNVCLHHCTVLTSASVRSSGWQMLKSMQILF